MHPSLPAVRLVAAIACRASDEIVRARHAEVADHALLLDIAGKLGMTLALDARADDLELSVDMRRRLVASAMLTGVRRDASLRMLEALHDAAVPSERAIVIKGGAFALMWPAHAYRTITDVDVVIPEADVGAWLDGAATIGVDAHRTRGYEAAHLTCDRGMIELHLALPGFAGNDEGPGWEALHARSRTLEGQPWRVPIASVAREIAVQHFLFHHGGEAGHALRTLQDLTLLEDDAEGDGLDWGTSAVARATTRMREIARSIRDGRDAEPAPATFLAGLTTILGEQSSRSFAEESRHWIGQQPGTFARLALLARRLVPPLGEMRHTPDDSAVAIAARYARRPFELLGRYRTAAKLDRTRSDAVAQWRSELERLAR